MHLNFPNLRGLQAGKTNFAPMEPRFIRELRPMVLHLITARPCWMFCQSCLAERCKKRTVSRNHTDISHDIKVKHITAAKRVMLNAFAAATYVNRCATSTPLQPRNPSQKLSMRISFRVCCMCWLAMTMRMKVQWKFAKISGVVLSSLATS